MENREAPSARAEWRAHGAVVAAATSGVAFSAVAAASLGVMMGPIEQEFGWTRTQISTGTSIVSLSAVLLATAVGVAIDRVGARRIAIGATILLCVAVAMLSRIGDNLLHWYLLWMLVGMGGAAMPTVWLVPVSVLFTAGRGLAMAVALSGSGISTFLVPVVAHQFIEHFDWRAAYLALAAIWGGITLVLALLFFRSRQNPVSARSGARPADAAVMPGLSVREGFRSPNFYKLAFGAFGSTLGGVALVLNLVPVLIFTGLPRGTAATVAGLIGIATIVGRIIGGWLLDRMSAKVIAAAATLGATVLPLMLLFFSGSVAASVAAVVIYGLMGGAKIGAIAYLASRHLGMRAFGTLYGTINAGLGLAVALAPLAANYVYDLTRSYTPVMWAAVPVLVIAAILYLSLGRYPEFTANAKS